MLYKAATKNFHSMIKSFHYYVIKSCYGYFLGLSKNHAMWNHTMGIHVRHNFFFNPNSILVMHLWHSDKPFRSIILYLFRIFFYAFFMLLIFVALLTPSGIHVGSMHALNLGVFFIFQEAVELKQWKVGDVMNFKTAARSSSSSRTLPQTSSRGHSDHKMGKKLGIFW